MNQHVKITAGPDGVVTAPTAVPGKAIGRNWFMWACCAAMVVGFGLTIAASATLGFRQALLAALPLVACLAIHFALHRFVGRSCHGPNSRQETEQQ